MNHGNRSLKSFKVSLAKELVGDFRSRKAGGRPSLDNTARFVERHFPDLLPMKENGKRTERQCVVCSKEGKRKMSCYGCTECNVGLRAAPCFRLFHTRQFDYLAAVSFVLLYLAFLLYLVTNVKRTANYIEI